MKLLKNVDKIKNHNAFLLISNCGKIKGQAMGSCKSLKLSIKNLFLFAHFMCQYCMCKGNEFQNCAIFLKAGLG